MRLIDCPNYLGIDSMDYLTAFGCSFSLNPLPAKFLYFIFRIRNNISPKKILQSLEESKAVTMALGTAWKQMSWLYYQYLLVTALYMLEPWERTIFNSLLISIVGMAVYTGYVFMPQHIMAILHYFEIVP
ncbi:serine palmitoyltransferase small subunit A isoform X1 [Hypanus sabinus]|uniref:serine palmitoyltransferase small subunit A isoform X1 n=2 Tax=Hypanus sabinus TaxID=79690 RepID=UPI0028C4A54E|nr:serine palmitoyltransferase small subunit A isoform X1 [Hypanus sabinus]